MTDGLQQIYATKYLVFQTNRLGFLGIYAAQTSWLSLELQELRYCPNFSGCLDVLHGLLELDELDVNWNS